MDGVDQTGRAWAQAAPARRLRGPLETSGRLRQLPLDAAGLPHRRSGGPLTRLERCVQGTSGCALCQELHPELGGPAGQAANGGARCASGEHGAYACGLVFFMHACMHARIVLAGCVCAVPLARCNMHILPPAKGGGAPACMRACMHTWCGHLACIGRRTMPFPGTPPPPPPPRMQGPPDLTSPFLGWVRCCEAGGAVPG